MTLFSDNTMDFIESLPSSHGKTIILVVMDHLSKFNHFISLSHPLSAKQVAQAFLSNVYKMHGIPNTITNDHDSLFMSTFWKEFFALLGVQLQFSTAYHLHTDGQYEVVNKCL